MNGIDDIMDHADDNNIVLTERELGQYVRYEDLTMNCDELEDNHETF